MSAVHSATKQYWPAVIVSAAVLLVLGVVVYPSTRVGAVVTPTYANYAAPASFPGAHNAGEPSIGSNFNTGAAMYQAGLYTARVTFDDSVSPATGTWTNASANAGNGCPQGTTTSLDPILFTDHSTGRTFESQLSVKTALTCYTDNDGTSWAPTTGNNPVVSGVDHQTMGGGPWAAGLGGGSVNAYPHSVIYCSQDIAYANCAVSRDGGLTYGPAVPIYVPNKSCGGKQGVAVSEDNGASWTVRTDPVSTAGGTDPSVGIGSAGAVYMGYQAADGTPHAAVTRDKGRTWVNDQNVGAALGLKNVVFPAVVAGDNDRAAFAFLGTTTGGDYQASTFTGVWHLYVSTTFDGGVTWTTVDATPSDPVQRGSICTGGTTCGKDRNLLDFIDATIDKQGRVLVGYADGCTGTCATGGAENYDAYATIARQSGGSTLYASFAG